MRTKALFTQLEDKHERLSDTVVHTILEAEAEGLRTHPDATTRELANWVPSKRTISRIRTEDFAGMDADERLLFRTFHWPESMDRGDLPWEASGSALEPLFVLESLGNGGLRERPQVCLVKWFWRVSQPAAGGTIGERYKAAVTLTMSELLNPNPPKDGLGDSP